MKRLYQENKAKKVGEVCTCPSCGTSFVKSQHQQAFCKSKVGTICKDKYWNRVIPTKRCNTTRISPASARWIKDTSSNRSYDSFDDDQSWDAHKSY